MEVSEMPIRSVAALAAEGVPPPAAAWQLLELQGFLQPPPAEEDAPPQEHVVGTVHRAKAGSGATLRLGTLNVAGDVVKMNPAMLVLRRRAAPAASPSPPRNATRRGTTRATVACHLYGTDDDTSGDDDDDAADDAADGDGAPTVKRPRVEGAPVAAFDVCGAVAERYHFKAKPSRVMNWTP
jgi:hypothetical protein